MITVYYIPDGPKNLKALFNDLDLNNLDHYNLEVHDASGNVLATTPEYTYDKPCEEDLVLHFVNALGPVDSIKCNLTTIVHENKSDTIQVPLKYPLDKTLHGVNRINLKANDTYSGIILATEDQLPLVKELLDTAALWIESADSYIPIVLVDGKYPVLNDVPDRYEYQIPIVFTLSHDKLTIRA